MMTHYKKMLAAGIVALCASSVAHAHHVIGTITLPNSPEGLAANPITNRIFVAVPNFGSKPFDYLSVIDGSTDTVIKNIEIPPVAYAVASDSFAGLVYVGGIDLATDESEVIAISQKTLAIVGTIHVSSTPGDGIQGLAANPVTGDLYVSNASNNEVDVISGLNLVKRISVQGEPYGITVNPLLNRIYVALLDGNVSLIDGVTQSVTVTNAVGTSDAGITVDIANGKVFTTNAVFTNSSTVGYLSKNAIVHGTIPVGNLPIGIDVDPSTHNVYVANTQDGTVSVINGQSNKTFETLAVSGLFLTINPTTAKVYVGANNSSPTITVITEK